MSDRIVKLAFLDRVIACTGTGLDRPPSLMTTDDFARKNVLIACEAIQLGLVRLSWDGDGYELRITRAGRLLAKGELERAAATIDSGMEVVRLRGSAPEGLLGSRLNLGGQGIHLSSMSARQFAPEIMRGVATGHLVVQDGTIHAARSGEASQARASKAAPPMRAAEAVSPGAVPAHDSATGLPSSRSSRHVGQLGS